MENSAVPDVQAQKRAVRALILAARAQISPGERAGAGVATADAVLRLPRVRDARVVAAYVGIGVELPTSELLDGLLDRGIAVLLPVLEADNDLSWRLLVDRAELHPGRHGLLEPGFTAPRRELAEADVVVVPGVAYDRSGNRLGRGGGSYDRALRGLPRAVTTVGTAFETDVVDNLPVEEHDVPVSIIVTPTRVIEVGGR